MKKYTIKHYPGDEDSGAMSSWYVFSALGFFPNAGTNLIYLNAPAFPFAEVKLPGEKKIIILAENAGSDNIYIQSVSLNGRVLNRAIVTNKELMAGGILKFTLSAKPTKWDN